MNQTTICHQKSVGHLKRFGYHFEYYCQFEEYSQEYPYPLSKDPSDSLVCNKLIHELDNLHIIYDVKKLE